MLRIRKHILSLLLRRTFTTSCEIRAGWTEDSPLPSRPGLSVALSGERLLLSLPCAGLELASAERPKTCLDPKWLRMRKVETARSERLVQQPPD